MKMPNIAGLVGVGKAFVMANRPEILFGASIVSTVAAVVASARGGYVSGQQVMAEEYGLDTGPGGVFKVNELSSKEKAQLTWLNYLPAAGLTAGALGSTTGLHIVHIKDKKALAATALMAIDEVKKEAKQYEKALHEAGMTVKDDEKSLEAAANEKGVAQLMGTDGEIEELYLVRDARTGRDIWSSEERIKKALLETNEQLQAEGDASLGYFYTYAGYGLLDDSESLGWSGKPNLSVSWENTIRDDGRPVRAFTFRRAPSEGYQGSTGS